ncbi:DUF3617 domain-containing protein [Pseudorhodoplanes sp.]|uniref:DUF3617 domain-containing protein n=1 Tax=Pseudorhodoplanes sp. TaxID=1934341 RepID=UPI002C7AD9DE|nr:DUF3617 family protein [Pseudorhodoplanes sp.]HWV40433.1 DUF3617 family protein [Pseudorhodoplanes sp.]
MRSVLRFSLVLLPLIAAYPASAQSLEAGRWRVMTTTLSEAHKPPMVATRCLTAEDVADLGKTFGPQSTTENLECRRTEFSQNSEGMTWRLQCRGQIDVDVSAEFIFSSPVRYSALVKTRATMLDRIVQDNMVSISAERIGECRPD